MIIAIDETGDFSPKSNSFHFFNAVHIQNTENKQDLICSRFNNWEASLPRSLKNHNGEIKSSRLNEEQLDRFIEEIMILVPQIIVSSISFNPIENPSRIINKYKLIQQTGINEGILLFSKLNRPEIVKLIRDFSFWFRKLSYVQFVKLQLLGKIIYKSFKNTIGSSIVWGLENELLDIKFKIDEIFIKGSEQHIFWHEFLRNQLYAESVNNPIPFSTEWDVSKHPFVKKYTKNEILDFSDLFDKNCLLVKSHQCYEIRIADAVNTILSNYFNNKRYKELYKKLQRIIVPKGQIDHIIFNDFNVAERAGQDDYNPWSNKKDFEVNDL